MKKLILFSLTLTTASSIFCASRKLAKEATQKISLNELKYALNQPLNTHILKNYLPKNSQTPLFKVPVASTPTGLAAHVPLSTISQEHLPFGSELPSSSVISLSNMPKPQTKTFTSSVTQAIRHAAMSAIPCFNTAQEIDTEDVPGNPTRLNEESFEQNNSNPQDGEGISFTHQTSHAIAQESENTTPAAESLNETALESLKKIGVITAITGLSGALSIATHSTKAITKAPKNVAKATSDTVKNIRIGIVRDIERKALKDTKKTLSKEVKDYRTRYEAYLKKRASSIPPKPSIITHPQRPALPITSVPAPVIAPKPVSIEAIAPKEIPVIAPECLPHEPIEIKIPTLALPQPELPLLLTAGESTNNALVPVIKQPSFAEIRLALDAELPLALPAPLEAETPLLLTAGQSTNNTALTLFESIKNALIHYKAKDATFILLEDGTAHMAINGQTENIIFSFTKKCVESALNALKNTNLLLSQTHNRTSDNTALSNLVTFGKRTWQAFKITLNTEGLNVQPLIVD